MALRQLASHLVGPSQFDELRIASALLPGPGVMVDVGAHHGSSLKPFAERGWTVHAFEPDPTNRGVLVDGPGRLPGVHVDSRAVTEQSGDRLIFYTSEVSTGISSLTAFHPSHRPSVEVTTVTLADYLVDVEQIDLLKTDCEGHDLGALRSLDWTRHHPGVVVCEFEDAKTTRLGYTHRDLARFLEQQGYAVLVSEWAPISEYGRRHDWLRVARWPTQVADGGWGNFIAVGDPRAAMRAGRRVATQYRIRRLLDLAGRTRGRLLRRRG